MLVSGASIDYCFPVEEVNFLTPSNQYRDSRLRPVISASIANRGTAVIVFTSCSISPNNVLRFSATSLVEIHRRPAIAACRSLSSKSLPSLPTSVPTPQRKTGVSCSTACLLVFLCFVPFPPEPFFPSSQPVLSRLDCPGLPPIRTFPCNYTSCLIFDNRVFLT